MQNQIVRFVRDDEGQDLIEYVLLGSFIALVVVTGAGLLGTALDGWYTRVAGWVDGQGPVAGGS